MNTSKILSSLEQPLGKEWRPLPFWFWNGDLSESGIREQLIEMKAQGIGGVMISPRQGMNVPYLSEAYFSLFRYAAVTARELDLSVWIYDEFPYPSGISGGEVLMRHPELRQTRLEHKSLESGGGKILWSLGRGVVLDIKAVPVVEGKEQWNKALDLRKQVGILPVTEVFQEDSGLTVYNLKRYFTHDPEMCLQTDLPEGVWHLTACIQTEIQDFKYYNGYIDPCDARTAAAFIETTHERYKDAVGDLFGSVIQGVFTDETGLLGDFPWTRLAPEAYRAAYGEDLCPRLCEIFSNDSENAPCLREKLYRVIHHMLQENYHHPLSEWCREHHLLYIAEVPGMRMSTQIYSDVTGGDFNHEKIGVPLDEIHDLHTANYRHNPTAISSLARQLGHGRALVESFHSIGWSMTLQDAKWGLDYITACGINWFNFHAFFYSTEGLRKYDAPPSQFCQNPYWKHYRLFSDFVARNSFISNHTEADVRIAILEPTTSLWRKRTNPFDDYVYAGNSPAEEARHEAIRNCWFRTRRALFHGQISFDHLDPEMLARASIREGRILIGKADYRLLIITESDVLEPETCQALLTFTKNGGSLISVGNAPDRLSDGTALPVELPFIARLSDQDEKALHEIARRYAEVPLCFIPEESASKSCISHLRLSDENEPWLFVANQEENVVEGKLLLSAPWHALWKISADGGRTALSMGPDGSVSLRLEAYESAWFAAVQHTLPEAMPLDRVELPLDGEWPCRLHDKNCLRLSFCDYSTDEKNWFRSDVKPFLHLVEKAGDLSGQAWKTSDYFGLPKRMQLRFPQNLHIRMRFEAADIPADLALSFEGKGILGETNILMNGHLLNDWQKTVSAGNTLFHCRISGYAQTGLNTLDLRITVHHEWEGLIDALFLEGSFSVERSGECPRIRKLEEKAVFNPETPSWAPHYTGEIEWKYQFNSTKNPSPVVLVPRGASRLANCISLSLNGTCLGARAFSPYGWIVPEKLLRDGMNEVTLVISNTLVHRYEGRSFDYQQHALVSR